MTQVNAAEQAGPSADNHVFAVLRERLYGAISCLATLAVLARYTTGDTSAWARLLDVAVATGGLWAASLFADFVAHLGVYEGRPSRREVGAMLQASGQILQAAVIPAGILAAAGFGLLKTYTAMWVAMWAIVAELGLIALFAVRKTQLHWWQKLLTGVLLASFGAVVVVIKMLAH
ncbi:hypothetical protein MANY_42460 [Mycolicibacterium anyangense]|uniref:Uncharacterized protein n=1 Tax=Mycolicibacterium anyangense TaxID=1431246 RepID=A0A6N4WCY7_9MYCO|nr:hypothetical protein [Mycolicibacterium anyangense]BBZ78909.1 hypothetical protein MANY_42460 [Mycolicibacterium anyangense]